MSTSINLQGLSIQNPTPGNFLELDFAVGLPAGVGVQRPMILMGNMTTAGSATPDTVIYGPDTPTTCQTEPDVIGLFGLGSELHRMYRRAVKIQQVVSIYFIAITASAGAAASLEFTLAGSGGVTSTTIGTAGSGYTSLPTITFSAPTGVGGVTATGVAVLTTQTLTGITITNPGSGYFAAPTITITGGGGTLAAATATVTLGGPTTNGNIRIWIDDQFFDTGFLAGATLASITSAMVVNANTNINWAVTAAQATITSSNDSITFTCKIAGPRGNWHRGMSILTFTGNQSPSMTVTHTTDAPFAGGTTADSNTTALSTITSNRYYYICSAAEDATQFGALASQLTVQSLPLNAQRERCFTGSSDSLSNVQTIASGINNPRADIGWLQTSPIVPSELGTIIASVYAQGEMSGSKPVCNYDFYGNGANDTWPVIAPRVVANIPTAISITSALNNGVTPIGVNQNKTTYLVKAITTRSLNGSANDYRIRDHHKVTVCDFFCDDLITKFGAQFQRKNLADDPPAGTSVAPPGGDTVTPNRIRDSAFRLITDYGEPPQGTQLLVNTAQTKANSVFQREAANRNRVSCLIPLFTVDVLDQIAVLSEQVG